MQAKTPKEARQLGLKTYFTGVPCKRGGVADRRLNGDCLCDSCVDHTNYLKAKWVMSNRSKHLASKKKWAEKNKERQKETTKAWTEQNSEKVIEIRKKWADNNRDKLRSYKRNRRAAKMNAKPQWFGEFDRFVLREASALTVMREKTTGIKWHVDHMIPLQAKTVCGFHVANNIQVIPAKLNAAKLNNLVYVNFAEWIKEI